MIQVGPLPTQVDESSWKDYVKVANPIGMPIFHREDYGAEYDDTFSLSKHDALIKQQPIEVQEAMIGAVSEEDMFNRMHRTKEYLESGRRIAEDPAIVKYPAMLAAGITDPINVIPVAGAMGKAKTLIGANAMLGRVATTSAIVGGVGAISNVASEALFDIQDLPTDYLSSALFGFIVGGGLGALGEGLSKTSYQTDAAKAFTKPDELEVSLERDRYVNSDGTISIPPEDVPRVKDWEWYPAFMKSDTMKSWASPLPSVRKVISRLSNPILATRYSDGTLRPTDTTAKDKLVEYNGILNTTRMEAHTIYKEEKLSGLTNKKFEEWSSDIIKDLHGLSARQEMIVKSSPEYKEIGIQYNKDLQVAKAEYELKDNKILTDYNRNIKDASPETIEFFTKQGDEQRALLQQEYDAKVKELTDQRSIKVNSLYEGVPLELNSKHKTVKQYFDSMFQIGTDLRVPELKGISKNKLYIPRQYDVPKIRTMQHDNVRNVIYRAMEAHPDNVKMSPEDMYKVADKFASDLKNVAFSSEFNDFSYFVPKDIGVSKHLLGRKISVDTAKLTDILQNDMEEVLGMYHYWQARQYATRWAFPELQDVPLENIRDKFQEVYVQPIFREAEALGIEHTNDVKALENVFNDIMGFQRLPKKPNSLGWKVSRSLTAANAITYSGMFGLNTLAEIPSALWATGFNRIFSTEFAGMFTDISRSMLRGTKPDKQLLQEFIHMGQLQSMLTTHGMNRLADTEGVFNVAKWEHKLMNMTQSIYKWNGMRALTATLEAVVGSNAVEAIRTLGSKTKLSEKELVRLAHWGLTHGEAIELAKDINSKATINKKGYVSGLNLDKWDEITLSKLQTVVNRAVESGVLQGDTMHLPSWMIAPDPVRRIVFQFMRYPITAQEVLMRKGFNEDIAGWTASAFGAMATYMGMIYLIEQSEIAAGIRDEVDAKFDIATEEGRKNAFIKSINYVSAFGAFTMAMDYGATLSGNPRLGRDYADRDVVGALFGVSGGRASNFATMMHGITNGEYDDERTWRAAKSFFIPMNNLPVFGQALNKLIEENTR